MHIDYGSSVGHGHSDYLSLKAIQWMWRFCVVRVIVSELITDEQ